MAAATPEVVPSPSLGQRLELLALGMIPPLEGASDRAIAHLQLGQRLAQFGEHLRGDVILESNKLMLVIEGVIHCHQCEDSK